MKKGRDTCTALFYFSKCSEELVFTKKSRWNVIFLVLSGKMLFLFTENMILIIGQKMKDDLSQKNTWEYDNFFKCSEKMVFSKKSLWNMILLILSGKVVFFYPKIWYFFFRRKIEDDLSQEMHANTIFSVYMYKCYIYDITLLLKRQYRE